MTRDNIGLDVEQLLLKLCAEVLLHPEDQIKPEDSFIGLGGDSFKAIKLKRKCDQLGLRLSLRDILTRNTISAIAAGQASSTGKKKRVRDTKHKAPTRESGRSHGHFDLMPRDYDWSLVFKEVGILGATPSPEGIERIAGVYPCSPMQESIYVARETKGNSLYIIHELFELGQRVTPHNLQIAWRLVVDRHESLRTIFVPTTDPASSRLLDAVVLRSGLSEVEFVKCKDYAAVLESFDRSCIDPAEFRLGPLHRHTIYDIEDGRRYCQLELSHMISDGASVMMILDDLHHAIGGSSLDPAPGYSRVIRHNSAVKESDESIGYWTSFLRGIQPCNFPSLRTGSRITRPSASDACNVVELPVQRHAELSAFCAKMQITMSTLSQAVWAILLRTYSGNEDVYFAQTTSGRDIQLDGVEMICGPLVNLVVRRVSFAEGKSLRGMIETIQDDFVNSLEHQSVPFMRVQQLFKATERMFNTILTVQYAPSLVDECDNLPLRRITAFNATDFGLSMHVTYSETITKTQLTYSTSLLSAVMAERVMKTFLSIIDSLLDTTDFNSKVYELPAISISDCQTVTEWNRETLEGISEQLPDATIHELVEQATLHAPGSPAIYFSGEILTYQDLDCMSTCLAHQILKSLSNDQQFIPLFFEKSAMYSIALLAVLKTGRAFVPIDISNPPDRTQRLFEQLGVTPSSGLVICSKGRLKQLQSICHRLLTPSIAGLRADLNKSEYLSSSPLLPMVNPDNPAYIIFTSGSTGQPKGVVVSHRAYAHAARTHASGIHIDRGSRVLQFASYAFDTSMEDHLTTFIVGACLCVPTEVERDTALVDFINVSGANWIHITPSMMVMIPPLSVPSLRTIALGGEPMTNDNVSEWAVAGRRLIQVYGPSECSVTSTINSDVSIRRDPSNIGRAFAGCATWITDANDSNILSPIGAVGELLMEGPILATCYLGNKSATDVAFVTSPSWAPGKRLYRTGDLVQYDERGELHFVGRLDSRIKLRGQRIECGEIESQLIMQKSVLHAVVVVPKSGPGTERLIAAVSLKPIGDEEHLQRLDADIHSADLEPTRESELAESLGIWLADRIPPYMIPDLFVFVRHIPMNSSRKLDRKKVARYIESMSRESYQRLVDRMNEPVQDRLGTELEHTLKNVWCRVLNVPDNTVNWHTSWFSSGGDSISAMMLSSELRKQSIRISAADVLRLRNIERIATRVQKTVASEEDLRYMSIDHTVTHTDVSWDLSPIQQLSFQFFPDGDNFDQQIMVVDTDLDLSNEVIARALDAVTQAHPMLHARFTCESSAGSTVWRQHVTADSVASTYAIRFHQDTDANFILRTISETKSRINLVNGPIMGVDVFRSAESSTISICIHHLVVDMVSWRIIFQDLEDLLTGQSRVQPEPISFQAWSKLQRVYAQTLQYSETLPRGEGEVDTAYWGMEHTPNVFGDATSTTISLDPSQTSNLLEVCDKLGYSVVDVLSAAISTSFYQTFESRTSPVIFVEGHGREPIVDDIDLSRTVGWFTTFSPVTVQITNDNMSDITDVLHQVQQFREATPRKGLDYFTYSLLRSDGPQTHHEGHTLAEIVVNYLGVYQQFERATSAFRRSDEPEIMSGLSAMRREQRKKSKRYSLISLVAVVRNGSLAIEIEWNKRMRFQRELNSWSEKVKDQMLLLMLNLAHMTSSSRTSLIPPSSEFTQFGINKQETLNKVLNLGISQQNIESMYPCSPMQEGLMASLLRDADASSAYDQTFLLKFTSPNVRQIQSDKIVEVWRRIVQKHAVLRTIFVESQAGEFVQVVLRRIDPKVVIRDGVNEEELKSTLFESENKSLDSPLSGCPLHQITVAKAPNGTAYMLLTKSHLLTDGISTQILKRELELGCAGHIEEAHPRPHNYFSDYIRYILGQDADYARNYWRTYLEGGVTCNFPRLCYGTEAPDAKIQHSSVSLQLDSFDKELRAVGQAHDLTISSIFLLAWAQVLRTYLNSDDILFGLLTSGRDLPVAGLQEAVGPVANMLPIKTNISPDMKAVEVAKHMQSDYIEHLSRQHLSLAQILHAARHGSQVPSFNTILNIQKAEVTQIYSNPDAVRVDFVKSKDTTEYGLALTVMDRQGVYYISLEYETCLISQFEADAIVGAFEAAVKNFIVNPYNLVGDISLANDKDRAQIQDWDIAKLETKDDCVHRLFQATALSIPGNEAICAWDGRLTFGELETMTNKLSRELLHHSVQPEEIVCLCFEKSVWGIVAMIGVMKAGATFVHLDPESPLTRKQKIVEITTPRIGLASTRNTSIMESLVSQTLTVCDAMFADNVNFATSVISKPETRVNPSNALYVIFTSGSTGEPKGVVIEHRNFCSAMAANAKWLQILPSSRLLQFSSFVFDACMEEILTALVAGACVCVPSDDQRMSPDRLTTFIKDARVNWAALTPSFLQTLDPNAVVPPLDFITVHAEAMNASLARLWSPRVHMRPSYGPTECTVTSTVGEAFTDKSDPSNIGWPVGCHGRITNPQNPQQLVPIGAVGELVLEGPILARGYLKRPIETEKAFPAIQDWFDGSSRRIYRTGDLVRYARDGSLRILGRRDTQVKVRGQRVELGEIQSQLDLSPEIYHSLILQPKAGLLSGRLVAVLSLTHSHQAPESGVPHNRTIRLVNDPASPQTQTSNTSSILHQMQMFVSAKLPSYMIPHTWCVVEAMPTLASFKLDRKLVNNWLETMEEHTLLLARQLTRSARESSSGITDTEDEKLVRAAWSNVLEMSAESIDIDDHFIALGGDSITAMHVSRFLNKAGASVKTQDVLRSNSIRELALALRTESPPEAPVWSEIRDRNCVSGVNPTIEQVLSEHDLDMVNKSNILSAHRSTPFQSRTTKAVYAFPWRPYLYSLFAEIGGYSQEIDVGRLLSAWRATIGRHEILRTAVPLTKDGSATYQIVLNESTANCATFDAGSEEEAQSSSIQKTKDIKASLSSTSLTPPLWLDLYVTPTKRVYMHMLMGHMLIDHVSLAHVLYDWDALYRNDSSLLPDVSRLPRFSQYVDDIGARNVLASNDYWSQKLSGANPTTLTPSHGLTDNREAIAASADAPMSAINFKIEVDAKMDQYCRSLRVTVSTLLQFAWAVLLSVYTKERSVCFGHLASDRDVEIDDADNIVGPMLTVLVTHVVLGRTDSSSVVASIEDVIRKVQDDNTDAMAHKVFDLSAVERRLGLEIPRKSLFNTLINYRKVKRIGKEPVMKLRSLLKEDPHEVSA
ncbi:peptide synthetase [Xylariaceae sp. FL1019]|nr:peptide synthetase [Xylariaceae sp. FL1019]